MSRPSVVTRWAGVGAVLLVTVLVVACTAPAPPGGTTTTTSLPGDPSSPVISSFVAIGSGGPAPLTVALRWTISDPSDLEMVCELDTDGDGTYDQTIVSCTSETVRTVDVPTPGTTTVGLRVSDGASPAVTRTVTVVAGAPASEPFDITLLFVGSFTPVRTAAFNAAAARWSEVIHTGLPNLSLNYAAGGCGADAAAFSGTIDDVLITASVTAIDGPGKVLASAGPCYYRTADGLALAGAMQFDVADIGNLENSGDLEDVVLHEMGHVLGIGTLPGWSGNQSGAGTSTSAFIGPRAQGAWQELGGSGAVPVENNGVPGTTDSHWRESVFDRELMTGYEDAGNDPLSRLTVAALGDLGYGVNLTAAEAFLLPLPSVRMPALRESAGPTERLLLPVGGVG
ncbi:MAG: leishmanolysin-related zinc metalloendopeptidase [Actinomycetes bacterium]